MAESDSLMTNEEVVCHHNSHQRRKEDRERTQHCDKCGSFVDQLPRLNNPCCRERNDGTSADVDVSGEHTGKVNASSDSVSTYVLEQNGEGEGQSQKENTCSCT